MGFARYGASFFLVAVDDYVPNSKPERGYDCAFASFFFGIRDVAAHITGRQEVITDDALDTFSLLASRLINVFFLIYAVASAILAQNRYIRGLGYLVLAFTPFCWIEFSYRHLSPRADYFLWTAGILLVLMSRPLLDKRLNTPSAISG